MAFVHLHNHTEYSLLDGLTHIKDMVRRAAELDMPAVAVTDHGVMSGMVELSDACDAVEKETGKRVKPIFGCEVYFTPDESLRKDVKPKLYHLLLLAKNNEGYHNLLKLVSESHVDNFYYKPRTTFSMLQKYGHGIIGSSACIAGVIPKLLDERRFDDAVEWARKFASCFDEGDFYIELQNQGIRTDAGFTQTELNHELTRVAKAAGLKTIATNDFHYLLKEDAEAQDIMLCIGTGSTVNQTNRMKFENDQFYMKTEEEMREAMKDFPEACDNTVEVAAKCDVTLEREPILPKFPLPEGETEESWFRKRVQEGLEKRRSAPTTRWASSSSRASRPTSSSCRSTSNGRAARASAWARAAARPPAPSWPTPWASPTLTLCPTASCSSDSSRPSAWRCPISTSTSSRAAAKRSSTTSRTSTARTTSPR